MQWSRQLDVRAAGKYLYHIGASSTGTNVNELHPYWYIWQARVDMQVKCNWLLIKEDRSRDFTALNAVTYGAKEAIMDAVWNEDGELDVE